MMLRGGLAVELPPGLRPSRLADSGGCARGQSRRYGRTGVSRVRYDTPGLGQGEVPALIVECLAAVCFWERQNQGFQAGNLPCPTLLKDGRQHAFTTWKCLL